MKWFPKVVKVFTYAAAKREHFRAVAVYLIWKLPVGPKCVRHVKMGAKIALNRFPEVVNVFTYAAVNTEHFMAVALYF